MHIVVVGVDHTTAPIALRERLTYSSRQIPQVLQSAREAVLECVLLSTCNRMELYAVCSDSVAGRADLWRILSEDRQVAYADLEGHCYDFTDEDAVSHLFAVACGLRSLIPGEPQIQGQVADALDIAQGGGYAGPVTSALFRAALVAGKRARSETGISRNAASISHAAVQLAHQLFPRLNESCVLLVGSGQMSELAARNLSDHGARRLIIVNRTQAHALALAEQLGAVHRPFTELAAVLVEADVVISSTRAPRALITTELMQEVMRQRAGRSLLLIDIALPRDVDPAVGSLPGVHLYNLDDLRATVDAGIRARMQEVVHVEAIIAQEVALFERWQRSLSVVDTISDLRQHVDDIRQQELARTIRQLSPALSERELATVQELTTRLVNKLLHKPTLRLKEAAVGGQGHAYAEALRYLFGLEVEKSNATDYDRHQGQRTGHDADPDDYSASATAVARVGDNSRANSH